MNHACQISEVRSSLVFIDELNVMSILQVSGTAYKIEKFWKRTVSASNWVAYSLYDVIDTDEWCSYREN